MLFINDKMIKFWKVYEKYLECVSGFNVYREEDRFGFRWMNGGKVVMMSVTGIGVLANE